MAKDLNQGIVEYQNQENYDPTAHSGEINTEKSLTVPNQNVTIEELLERAKAGQTIEEPQNIEFFDIEELETLPESPIDFTDLDKSRTQLKKWDTAIRKAIKAKEEAEAEEAKGFVSDEPIEEPPKEEPPKEEPPKQSDK